MAWYRATYNGAACVGSRDVVLVAGELVELTQEEATLAEKVGWVEPVDRGGRPVPTTPEARVASPVKRKRAHV